MQGEGFSHYVFFTAFLSFMVKHKQVSIFNKTAVAPVVDTWVDFWACAIS